jgi:hypothetical protein
MRFSCSGAEKRLFQPVAKAPFHGRNGLELDDISDLEQYDLPFSLLNFFTGAKHFYEDPR